MRINKQQVAISNDYKLMIVDDDASLIDSISSFLTRNGYNVLGVTDPTGGLDRLHKEKFDLLILDYFMSPIKGDEFVSKLREFDRDLYVILLTGHKDLAPPFATIKAFDIQAYCEKSHKLDQLMLLIESGIKSITQRVSIMNYRDGLTDILSVLPEIYRLESPDAMLDAALNKVTSITDCNNVFALIDVFRAGGRTIYKGTGMFDAPLETVIGSFDAAFIDAIDEAKTSQKAVMTEEGVVFPVIGRKELYEGIVYINCNHGDDRRYVLEIFITNVGALIHNAYLNDELRNAYSDLKSSFVETIEALRLAVDAKDVYTRGHSDRVAKLAQIIGEEFDLGQEELEEIRIAGLFHDIGKIGISDDILLKDSSLSPEEYAEIKTHPLKGAMILSAISAFDRIKVIVCCHHEHIDGGGYPAGLEGDDIPLGARIINVADAYDAMAFDRHYRKRLSQEAAIKQLTEGCDTQFDRNVVDRFTMLLAERAAEIEAILNSGF